MDERFCKFCNTLLVESPITLLRNNKSAETDVCITCGRLYFWDGIQAVTGEGKQAFYKDGKFFAIKPGEEIRL
jgi:hypothetical protein